MVIISLGAGVQSTTMALMAAEGELTPMPDAALFADTGWEPKAVYAHLEQLEAALPFPVHRVSAGNILEHIKSGLNTSGQDFAIVPWFTSDGGMGRRQCTREFKIEPLERKQRELLGYKKRQRIPPNSIEVWIGISLDESLRMKPARNVWQVNRWPLIEKGLRRRNCIDWLAARGWTAPKSACVGCPYHSDEQWRDLRDNAPEDWQAAVEVDRLIRHQGASGQYMHPKRVPLDQVDLSTPSDWGQLDLFNNECEGLCGV